MKDESVSNLAPWKNSVGAGIRLYVRQIVLPLLGLDFGYGLESGGVGQHMHIGGAHIIVMGVAGMIVGVP